MPTSGHISCVLLFLVPCTSTQVISPGARVYNRNRLPQSKHVRVTSLQFGQTRPSESVFVWPKNYCFLVQTCWYFDGDSNVKSCCMFAGKL